jgi:chromosome segregation ATPase
VQDQQAPPETPFEELNQALAAARAKLDELASGAEVAALAMRLRQELETVKAQNQGLQKEFEELHDSQSAAREKVELAERRLAQRERAMAALAAEDEARSKEAERTATEAAQLRRQLAAARSELEDARTSRDDAKARLSDMQQVVDGALSEGRRWVRRLPS